MKIHNTLSDMRVDIAKQKLSGKTIAFVPTMGNLHAGHLDLIKKAKAVGDYVIVSIFVNPKQFGPSEDFVTYPRTLNNDISLIEGYADALLFQMSRRFIHIHLP